MSFFYYLAFLSLVVISLCKNLTCKYDLSTAQDPCVSADYCVTYRKNSTTGFGSGCDVYGYCQQYNIGNNECKCGLTVGDPVIATAKHPTFA
uniref:Uncharacterized protein n=1 Tax=Acrobeloides nanus TaxID=290746 RepID=A0A914CGE8_9BILA